MHVPVSVRGCATSVSSDVRASTMHTPLHHELWKSQCAAIVLSHVALLFFLSLLSVTNIRPGIISAPRLELYWVTRCERVGMVKLTSAVQCRRLKFLMSHIRVDEKRFFSVSRTKRRASICFELDGRAVFQQSLQFKAHEIKNIRYSR